MKAVLFDLDGTLLDTLRDIADSCNAALARHGFPAHPVDAYRYFVGDGVPVLIQRVLPKESQGPELRDAIIATYREEYHRRWNATTRPYPGIPELLDRLGERSILLTVLSNKPHDFTLRCVEEFLPEWKFAMVLGASPAHPTKPDPSAALHIAQSLGLPVSEFLYLGDTATDMQTAVASGMLPVGVAWGFRPVEELRSAGAQRIITTPLETLVLL